MRVFSYPAKLADRIIDRLMAVVGALLGSQAPGFLHHYLQRLEGHLDEAVRNLETWKEIADKASIGSVQGLANVYRQSSSTEVVEAGAKCLADIARVDELRLAYESLANASVWERPFAFIKNVDSAIMESTFADFVPNVPLDIESLAYAVLGLVFVVCLYAGSKRLVITGARKAGKRLRKKNRLRNI